MTADYIAAASGAILIAVAILGRRISVRSFSILGIGVTVDELRVPPLPHSLRAVLGILGAALLASAGFGWERIGGWIGPAERTLTITNRLASRQEFKRIHLFIEGRQAAILAVDREDRAESVRVRVSHGDRYALSGTEASRGEDGAVRVRRVGGSGAFDLTDARSGYSILQRGAKTAETTLYELKPTRR